MEFIKDQLEEIDDSLLSPTNLLKKKHLVRIATVCAKFPIVDSQNLKQIYDLYKAEPIDFNKLY
jgi:hypothetical protein